MAIVNAKIENVSICIERGKLTYWINTIRSDGNQMFGGRILTTETISSILKIINVDKWEDLIGEAIRVSLSDRPNPTIVGIGNFLEDKWYFLDKKNDNQK